jgi:hypothetical protein
MPESPVGPLNLAVVLDALGQREEARMALCGRRRWPRRTGRSTRPSTTSWPPRPSGETPCPRRRRSTPPSGASSRASSSSTSSSSCACRARAARWWSPPGMGPASSASPRAR